MLAEREREREAKTAQHQQSMFFGSIIRRAGAGIGVIGHIGPIQLDVFSAFSWINAKLKKKERKKGRETETDR